MMPIFNTSCLDIKHGLNRWFEQTSGLTTEEDFKKVACCLPKEFKEAI